MQSTRLQLCLVLGSLLGVGTAPATAAPRGVDQRPIEIARRHFRLAERQFNLGRFREAIVAYRRAYAVRPLPGLLFNIAQCWRNLGRCGEAVFYYRRFLARRPGSRYADDIRRIIAGCRPARERPLRHLAPPGKRRPAAAPRRSPRDSHRPQAIRADGRPALLWSGVALTGALAVGGAITGALALERHGRFRDGATPAAERPALQKSGEDLSLATNILWAATAASAAITGLIYWLHRPAARERPTTATATLAPRAGGAVVGLGGRF